MALALATLLAASTRAEPPAVWTIDGGGRLRPIAATWASIERRPPAPVPADPRRPDGDPDALRYLFAAEAGQLPAIISVASLDGRGNTVGRLTRLPLQAFPCPAPVVKAEGCAVTPPIRAVADEVDARHPLVRDRSLVAELGGVLVLRRPSGVELGRLPVGGPRTSAIGPIQRYRARLRVALVRGGPSQGPPVGIDRPTAVAVASRSIRQAERLWGACGVSFGGEQASSVSVVPPPPAFMLSLGCGHAQPASGGTLRFAVDGRAVRIALTAGMTPSAAARRVARALEREGNRVQLVDNPAAGSEALGSTDVLVKRAAGDWAVLSPLHAGGLSDDRTMTACIGRVALADGLQHFRNVDSAVGSVEERTLLHAVDDADPATITVIIVPGFALGGRIGESFIASDAGAHRGVVIVDRGAIRAATSSYSLAHEIGHVLLDDPGHPDDWGRDTPSRLMDADAADAGAFGPRRLRVSECVRAVQQSGPGSPRQILEPWPLTTPPAGDR